jgi:2-oxoglutarate ferredoxin oxidoreductase subunit beta
MKEAMKHKGFAFVEIIQPCIIFHKDIGYKEKTYFLEKTGHDKTSFDKAWKKAQEFDYNKVNKIPLGIFYQVEQETFEDKWPQLKKLKEEKKSWKEIKR